jgi:hypothetical protein
MKDEQSDYTKLQKIIREALKTAISQELQKKEKLGLDIYIADENKKIIKLSPPYSQASKK